LTEGNILSLSGYLITIPLSLATAFAGCQIFGRYVFDKAIQFDLLSYLQSSGIWFLFSFFVCYVVVRKSAKQSSRLTIKEVLY